MATKSERKMLASTCLYSLYAWSYASDRAERNHLGQFFDERVARQTDEPALRQAEVARAQRTRDVVASSLVHPDAFQTRQTERVHARQLTWTRINL